MHDETKTLNGQRNSRLDYKRSKSRQGRPALSIRNDPFSGVVKTLAGMIGENIRRNAGVSGDFVPARRLYRDVITAICPSFPAHYEKHNGSSYCEDILYDRYHKQFYWNEAPTREARLSTRSPEHYLECKWLKRLAAQCEEWVLDGSTVTREMAEELYRNVHTLTVRPSPEDMELYAPGTGSHRFDLVNNE